MGNLGAMMFKWFTSRHSGQPSGAASAIASLPTAANNVLDVVGDAVSKVKEQLFFEWATETYGDQEGMALTLAYDQAKRCTRWMVVHGDFEQVRQLLLSIAMAFPNVGAMAAGNYDAPPNTDRYRKWLDRWCEAYPPPAGPVRK